MSCTHSFLLNHTCHNWNVWAKLQSRIQITNIHVCLCVCACAINCLHYLSSYVESRFNRTLLVLVLCKNSWPTCAMPTQKTGDGVVIRMAAHFARSRQYRAISRAQPSVPAIRMSSHAGYLNYIECVFLFSPKLITVSGFGYFFSEFV